MNRLPLLCLYLGLVVSTGVAAEPLRRPANILFLLTDEFRHDCLGVAGHPIVKTPNLDQLAAQGVRFTRAYAASPVCSPSRATLFTGRYPQVHGVKQNNLPFNEGELALPRLLRAHGYRTGIVGKLHLQAADDWFDFAEISDGGRGDSYAAFLRASGQFITGIANNAAVPGSLVGAKRTPLKIGTSVLPEDKYEEAWVADRAIDFLRAQKARQQPWFLFVSMFKPHSEYVIPAPFDQMYAARKMPLPQTFRPGQPPVVASAAKGEAGARQRRDGKADDGPGSRARLKINDADILREVIAHYYGAVTMVDKHLGRVLAALADLGLTEDTIIVFTSDHGNMLGERNRMFKSVMYESSALVPLMFSAPGRLPAGRVADTALDNTTIMPTLLELAGLPVPAGVQGRSLVPLMRGEGSGPAAAFAFLNDKMVRQGEWKLIVPLGRSKSGVRELYHVAADPTEQTNLYDRPDVAGVQQKLLALLAAWENQQSPPPVRLPPAN